MINIKNGIQKERIMNMANLLRRKRHGGPPARAAEATPMSHFQRELDRLFGDFWPEFGEALEPWTESFVPNVDVAEDDKEIRITAELPGMDENDIDVSISNGILTLQGEKKQEEEEKEKGYYCRESSYGKFYRRFPLSAEVDEDKADAEFKKGVLNIKLPKTETAQAKAKKIKVKSE